MTAYILRRVLLGILVLFMVTLFVFTVMRLLPGDPLMLFVGQNEMGTLSDEQLVELRVSFGLDKPLPIQYIDWINGIFHGDFGHSILNDNSVRLLILESLPVTLHLGIMAVTISSILGISFGTICALRRGQWQDNLFTVLANIGITIPGFWTGILLIYFFSLKLGWLPTYGYTSPFTDFARSLRQLIMPVFCLSLFGIASLTRQTRSSVLEVVGQDYIRTAWAKGLRERLIIVRHTLKNALIPVVTTMGMHVSFTVGGSVLIETIFNINGMGRLMAESVFSHDYQVAQGGVLLIAVFIVTTNIVVDIIYGWLDPRIRYS